MPKPKIASKKGKSNTKTQRSKSKNEEMFYRKKFVAFIDVLGFRGMVDDPEQVKKYFDYTKNLLLEMMDRDVRLKIFSDSIIISTPLQILHSDYPSLDFQNLLGDFCDFVASLQARFIFELGILMRGGITFGDFHHEGDFIAGPALTRAYDLESKFAKYPRVIVDPAILNSELKQFLSENYKLAQLNNAKFNDAYQIDFLSSGLHIGKDPGSLKKQKSQVDKLREVVLSGLYGYQGNLDKYLWLKDYIETFFLDVHNDFKVRRLESNHFLEYREMFLEL